MNIRELYRYYLAEKERHILDVVATSSIVFAVMSKYLRHLAVRESIPTGLLSELADGGLDPMMVSGQLRESLELAAPGLDEDVFQEMTSDQVGALLQDWRQKFLEVGVADLLNEGHAVSGISLPAGGEAEFVPGPTPDAPFELALHDGLGNHLSDLTDHIESMIPGLAYQIQSLPNVEVAELADLLNSDWSGLVETVSDDTTWEKIVSGMEDFFGGMYESPVAEVLEDVLFGLPVIVVVFAEGRQVVVGKRTFIEAVRSTFDRLALSYSVAFASFTMALWLGEPLLSLPIAVVTRLLVSRFKVLEAVLDILNNRPLPPEPIPEMA